MNAIQHQRSGFVTIIVIGMCLCAVSGVLVSVSIWTHVIRNMDSWEFAMLFIGLGFGALGFLLVVTTLVVLKTQEARAPARSSSPEGKTPREMI